MTCDRNCFECQFSDCVMDDVTGEERRAADILDVEARAENAPTKDASRALRYYYAHHKERLAYKKVWRESHKEERREYWQRYYSKNREKILAQNRERQRKNRKESKKGERAMKLTKKAAERIMKESGGSLYLSGTQITALPDNLTVGGWLDLRGTQITALPGNLTVGGWLYLRGTQITALPDNLTVGGSLDLSGTQITAKERAKVRRLINGQISHGFYIYADDRLFLYSGKSHKLGQYTVYVGKIPGQYLVTDGELWAHCKSFRAGVEDILFKRASSRGADQYKGADLDDPRTVEDLKSIFQKFFEDGEDNDTST